MGSILLPHCDLRARNFPHKDEKKKRKCKTFIAFYYRLLVRQYDLANTIKYE